MTKTKAPETNAPSAPTESEPLPYRVLGPIQYDRDFYVPGEVITLPLKTAQPLLEAGAIAVMAVESATAGGTP